MARILFTHSTLIVDKKEVLPPFYEGFLKSLVRNGNHVLHIPTNNFIKRPWNGTNRLRKDIKKGKLVERIKTFNPELVIAFNNSTIEGIDKILDCPIVLWNADTEHYYNDKDYIKENVDRFHFACATKYVANNPKNLFGASSKQIFIAPFSTDLRSTNAKKSYNVSFIGSVFQVPKRAKALLAKIADIPEARQEFLNFLLQYDENLNLDLESLIDKFILLGVGDLPETREGIYAILSEKRRNGVLQALAQQGLSLFGTNGSINWKDGGQNSILSLLAHPRLCYSILHNEHIYNSSKVCLSIAHAQAQGAYPWRVIDIMATSGCLLADYSLAVKEEFGDIIPMYSSISEAKAICKELLADDNKRRDISLACQRVIEENYRFEHRLKELENLFGLTFFNSSPGRITTLNATNFRLRFSITLGQNVKKRTKRAIKAFFA